MVKNENIEETLWSEIANFIQEMPFWLNFLSVELIEQGGLNDDHYVEATKYLYEDLEIWVKSGRSNLEVKLSQNEDQVYYQKAVLTKLEHLSGANALKRNMAIEFHPQLTVLFGENGAGKTSYSRLLKWSFFSRSKENILSNVFKDEKDLLEAKFYFETDEGNVGMLMPEDENMSLRDQFSVFDSKAIIKHLDEKNEFEFRPAGLVFFSELNAVVNELERRVNESITEMTPENPFIDLFEGESEIKNLIELLDEKIEMVEFDNHIPFSNTDETKLKEWNEKHDELLVATKQVDKTIQNYQIIIKDLHRNKKRVEELNSEFSKNTLDKISIKIRKVIKLEKAVKQEGLNSIQSDKFNEIASKQWKEFMQAAHKYALSEDEDYPQDQDDCIFCHQELSKEANTLMRKYWIYLESEVKEQLSKGKGSLDIYIKHIEGLSFDLFPEESRLAQWLEDNKNKYYERLEAQLDDQSKLPEKIIDKINERDTEVLLPIEVDCSEHNQIIENLEEKIIELQEGNQFKKLEELKSKITYLNHRKKLEKHFKKIKEFVKQHTTASKLQEVRWHGFKRSITECEKNLSSKYFSTDYVHRFNAAVRALNGQTQIEVITRGAAGSSNRQLLIKGNNPSLILSESEQKVAAISDFLAEMELSGINKGLFFDDPSTTLDDYRKSKLAKRLVKEALEKQIIIFTHDLAFLSSITEACKDFNIDFRCHWIENADGQPGLIYLDNTPSFEKVFKTTGKAEEWCQNARKQSPEEREGSLRSGFAALRTTYEALVVFEIFAGVVQRFTERVSVDSLTSVKFNNEIRDQVMDGFAQCCRYMEGHSHSDKYASSKPTVEALREEITRFQEIKKSIRLIAKQF